MERLKSILADKVLDLSAGSNEEVKAKIDKIQRFRDFANALKSLMVKYPAIEDELISMVEDGDFDTKVASSRVDTVIRLADNEAAQVKKDIPHIVEPVTVDEEPSVVPSVAEVIVENNQQDKINQNSEAEDSQDINFEPENIYINPDDIPMEVYTGEEEPLYNQPEDIEKEYVPYEDVLAEEQELVTSEEIEDISLTHDVNIEQDNDDISYPGDEDVPEIAENDYSDIKNIIPEIEESYPSSTKIEEESILEEEEDDDESNIISEEEQAAKKKIIIRRVLQIVGIILAVVALIFIVKFIMNHLQAFLIILGAVIVLVILIVWLKRKRR